MRAWAESGELAECFINSCCSLVLQCHVHWKLFVNIQAGVAKHDQQGNPAADAPQHRQGAVQDQECDWAQEPCQAFPRQHGGGSAQVEVKNS